MAVLVHNLRFENNTKDDINNQANVLVSGGYVDSSVAGSTRCLNYDSQALITSLSNIFGGNPLKFTISFWVKTNDDIVNSFFNPIFNLADVPTGSGITFSILGDILLINIGSGANVTERNFSLSSIIKDAWYNFIITYDSTSGTPLALLINGVSISPSGSTTSAVHPFTTSVFMYVGKTGRYNFTLDDFRIYNGIVDSGEIAEILLGEHETPSITSIDPSTFISNGALLRIYGTDLEGSSTTEITIDGVDYTANITSTSSTLITMIAPELANASYDLVVITNSIESDPYEITYSTRSLLDMPIRAPLLYQHYDNDDGTPVALGKIYTYAAGTSTPLATLLSDGVTEAANPVILDAAGNANVYLKPGYAYKFIVKTAADVTISNGTQDNITGVNSGIGSVVSVETIAELEALSSLNNDYVTVLGYTAKTDNIGPRLYYLNSASTATPDGGAVIAASGGGNYILVAGKEVDAKWFGATGNGITNEYTALYNANAYLNALGGGVLILSKGAYKFVQNLTFSPNVELRFLPGAYLMSNGALGVTIYKMNNDCLDLRFDSSIATVTLDASIPEVYPEWFGAVGTGTDSDSAPIQKAIDSHTTVTFTGDSYGIGTGISVPANRTLKLNKTGLQPTANSIVMLTFGVNADGETNSKLLGSLRITNPTSKTGVTGLSVSRSDGFYCEDVYIESIAKGVLISGARGQQYNSLSIKSCSEAGLKITASAGVGATYGLNINNLYLSTNQCGLFVNNTASEITGVKINNLTLLNNAVNGAYYNGVGSFSVDALYIEGNGSGSASATIDTLTVYKSDIYLDNSKVSCNDFKSKSSLDNSITLITDSTLTYKDFIGYDSAVNQSINCDSGSRVIELGMINATGYKNGIQKYGSLASVTTRMIAIGVDNTSRRIGLNFYTDAGNNQPQAPLPAIHAGAVVSALKDSKGYINQVAFDAAVGSIGTNDAVVTFATGMGGDFQISSILIKGATGSQVYTMVWEDNTTTYSNDITLPADVDTWRRLIFITAAKTSHKLTLFPTTDDAPVLYFSDAMTFDGDLETISNIYQNGFVNVRRYEMAATTYPTTGTWVDGDIVYATDAVSTQYIGWVCTAAPLTFEAFGAIL